MRSIWLGLAEDAELDATLHDKMIEPPLRTWALPGSGLGLGIVRETVRAHRVRCGSRTGRTVRGRVAAVPCPAG